MSPLLIAALISGIVSAGGAGLAVYKIEEGRYARKELKHVQQHADEAREALTMERKRQAGLQAAQNEWTRRMAALRADATRARDAVDGVRDATAAVLRNASASLETCTVSAAALGAVFGQCSQAYQGMAETADGLDNDRRTLSDAWPE